MMMLYSVPVLMASLEQREARRFNGSKNSEYFFNEKLAVRIITHSTQLVFPFYPIFQGNFLECAAANRVESRKKLPNKG